MMPRALKPGTRVRAKARPGSGWMGTGTVVRHYGTVVTLVKDGYPLEDPFEGMADMVADEIAVLKDQTPPRIEIKFDRSRMTPADVTSIMDAAVTAWKAAKPKTRKVRFEWSGWPFVSTLSSFSIQVDTPAGEPVAERYGSPDD